jgi:general secretion pathway protein D
MADGRNVLVVGALFALIASSPANVAAQDTTGIRRTGEGILVDFQDADLRSVITALAEAGNLNVSYGDLPARKVTLRLHQAVARADVAALLRSVAMSNGLRYSEEAGLIRLEATTGVTERGNGSDTTAKDVRLFVYRLKHARAARMAATMQLIFGGARTGSTAAPGLSQQALSDRLRGQAIQPFSTDTTRRAAADLGPMGTVLRAQLRGDIQIVPDESTNALLIRALPADWETVRQAVDAMDLRPLQALIEVVIAEVRTSDDLQLGMSGSVTAGNGANPPNTRGAELTSSAVNDFVLKLTQNNRNFTADLALAALAARGNVRILSRPIILAQNNQEAKILVGEQRPFVQVFRSLPTDAATRDQVVQYRDVATSLTILPTINPDGYVNLQVLQEVSAATDATQFGAPIISTREASTHLFVKDGQTAVLGGLVGRQTDKSRSGIPLLSRIPWLGALFGTTIEKTSTSELFLFLTPHVIASDDDLDAVRDKLRREGSDTTGVKPGEQPITGTPKKP